MYICIIVVTKNRAAGASEVACMASSEVDFAGEVVRLSRTVKFAPMAQVVDRCELRYHAREACASRFHSKHLTPHYTCTPAFNIFLRSRASGIARRRKA